MNKEVLQQQIADLEAKLSELKSEVNKLKPLVNYWQPDVSKSEGYYYVNHLGVVKIDCADDPSIKRYRVFKTEAEAEKYAAYIKAEETLRKAIAEVNEGWLPNWEDKYEYKYGFDLTSIGITITFNQSNKHRPTFMYIKSEDNTKYILNTYEKELKTYLSY